MTNVQPGLGNRSAGAGAHSSGYPVPATPVGRPLMSPDPEFKDKNDLPNTQGESSHSRSDLSPRDVRIAIDESTHPSSQMPLSVIFAAPYMSNQDLSKLSSTDTAIHQNVDKDLKERARQALSENGGLLQKMSDTYKDDKELVLAAVEQDPRAFRHASYRLKGDPDIVAIVVKDHVYLLLEHQTRRDHDSPDECLQNFRRAWAHINDPDTFLNNLPESFKHHRGILLEAIRINGEILRGVPENFKGDRAFVLEAIRINSDAINHVEDSLKQDTDIAVEIARHNIDVLPEEHAVRKVLTGIRENSLIDENGNLNVGEDLIRQLSMNKSFMKLAVHLDQDCRFFEYVQKNVRCFDDHQIVDLIEENPGIFKFATETQKKDREFVLEAVRQNAKVYTDLPWRFQNDIQIAVIAGLKNSALIRTINPDVFSQITAIRNNGMALENASAALKNCREFVLEAVRQDGRSLQYASRNLSSDREFVLEAVKQNGRSLLYASTNLYQDREFMLEAVKQNGGALQYASINLKRDREIVLEAVRQNGMALRYASINLKSDRKFMLEAVRQDGGALLYASEELKRDREIVTAAVGEYSGALGYASEELRRDKGVVLEAVRQDSTWCLQYVSEELRGDKEVIMEAVRQNGRALPYASEELKRDREVVMVAVKNNGIALQFASEELKDDLEVLIEAVQSDSKAGYFFSDEMKRLVESLSTYYPDVNLLDLLNKMASFTKPTVLEEVKRNGCFLQCVTRSFKSDFDIVLAAVSQDGMALEYASDELQANDEIVKIALLNNPNAKQFDKRPSTYSCSVQ
jgi:general stress protein YciG